MCFSPNSLIFTLCEFQIAVDNHHPYHPFIDDFPLSNCHLGQEASAKLPEAMDCMDCMGHLPVAPQLPILQRERSKVPQHDGRHSVAEDQENRGRKLLLGDVAVEEVEKRLRSFKDTN